MKRKIFLGAILSLLVSAVSFAQDGVGVDYYFTKEYDEAKSYFEAQVSQSKELGKSYYYLGEIALANGDATTAKSNFEKGLAADPECMLNNVGLGKLLLKTDPKAAENYISTATKKNKKDVLVIISAAYAYFENGMKDKALEKVAEARKANKKSPYVYVCEGDMFFAEKDPSGAATQYAQAMAFDSKSVIAYIRSAQVYENTGKTGAEVAIEELTKAITVRPDYMPAYRKLGRMYSIAGNYTKAIEMYQKFFTAGNTTAEDYANYAGSYYFAKENDSAKEILAQGLAKYPNDFYLNRILMYIAIDTEDYTTALAAGKKFFAADKGKASYLVNDYIKYGMAFSKNDLQDDAIAQFNKAVELDPENPDIYREAAGAASSAKKPDEAAKFYHKYIELSGDKVQSLDYYYLGRYYYSAGSMAAKALADTTTVISAEDMKTGLAYLAEADKAFGKVSEMSADSYLGYYWRARTNSALDPTSEKGLAKPYYLEMESKILNVIATDDSKTEETFKNELREGYKYLSFYFYLQYEKTKSPEDKSLIKTYSEKLLAIDPTDRTGQQLLDYVKK